MIFHFICEAGITYLWSIGTELVVRGSVVNKTGIVSVQLTIEFILRPHCEHLCTSLENGLKIHWTLGKDRFQEGHPGDRMTWSLHFYGKMTSLWTKQVALEIERKTWFENSTEVETPAELSSCLDWELMEKRVLGTLSVLVGISFFFTTFHRESIPTFSLCHLLAGLTFISGYFSVPSWSLSALFPSMPFLSC